MTSFYVFAAAFYVFAVFDKRPVCGKDKQRRKCQIRKQNARMNMAHYRVFFSSVVENKTRISKTRFLLD